MGRIVNINTTPYKLQPIPEVGKDYYAFDDGKIRPSRLEVVKIVKVIPFSAVNSEAFLEGWKREVESYYWILAEETDYFVKADSGSATVYFVRTIDGGWFSLGWWGSRLDVDGSLYQQMREQCGFDD